MKCIILAGGYGTRLAEETKIKPKPLVKIGNKPMIVNIINSFSNSLYSNLSKLSDKGYFKSLSVLTQ